MNTDTAVGTQTQPDKSPRMLLLSTNVKEWACPALFHEQQAILNAMPGSIIYGPGFSYNSNYLPDIVGELYGDTKPDAIICYVNEKRLIGEPLDQTTVERYGLEGDMRIFPRGLDRVSIPKIAWINDFWHCTSDEWEKILIGNGFTFAFSTCCPPFGKPEVFGRFFNRRVREAVTFVPWPRAISPRTFRDYNLPKIHDVTILGAMDSAFYPLRTKMHRAFERVSDFDYFNQPHPGYRYVSSEPMLVGEAYAKAINQSRIFATCSGIYKIPFMKYYEVIACRSMLVSDSPCGADELGFRDGETFVRVGGNNFMRKVRSYLAEPTEIDRISRNGMNLFLRRHTVELRAIEFREIVGALLAGKDPPSYAALFSRLEVERVLRSPRFFICSGLSALRVRVNALPGVPLLGNCLRKAKRLLRSSP